MPIVDVSASVTKKITRGSFLAAPITTTSLTTDTLQVGSQTPSADWTGSVAPNTVVYNGNRSYTLTFNSTNLTTAINAGTRLRTTRTTPAPTQSTSLNGTNQYWVKTSPNKLTFTDDFVVSAWVKINAYPASASSGSIITRFNGTSGWTLRLDDTGRPELIGFNASGGNFSRVKTYQSIPLGRWVHVAAQLDMSAFTASSTTSYIMLDGVDTPSAVDRGGTNPTALVQAGNLEIGSFNGGTNLINGKIAQAAVFNSKVTQATMQGYISQGLSGTETSLASAYSFNGVATDLNTTTPNDLSVGGGSATATNADSPYGVQASGLVNSTLDYGIVQSATFSTNTTLVVQVPEGNTIPTNSGGVTSVSYSTAKAPYGFPSDRKRWRIGVVLRMNLDPSSTSLGAYNPSGLNLNLPIGSWRIEQKIGLYGVGAAGAKSWAFCTSTTNGVAGKLMESHVGAYYNFTFTTDYFTPTFNTYDIVQNSQAPLYFILQLIQGSYTGANIRGDSLNGDSWVMADNGYL